jgi:gas vesicle protein
VNGSRLLEANVDDPTTLWTSSAARKALRRVGLQVERPEEVRRILESDDEPPTYSDLSTFTRKEWEDFKRSGARFESVGEELATRRVIAKERAKERRRQRTLPKVSEQPKPAPDEWDSDANDYESKTSADELEEDVSQGEDSQHRDADASERELFDGPFAVVIPSRKN